MKYRIETTKLYDHWFKKLKDVSSRIKILARLVRVENGKIILLLAGGDKSSQEKDIEKVTELLKELED